MIGSGAVDRHPGGAELRLRPGLARRPLVPGDHRDPATGEAAEQGRAPALPVEHQRQRGLGRLAGGEEVRRVRPRQAQPLQSRQDVLLQRLGHGRVKVLVQAEQRLAAQGVHPVARRGRQAELLARHEVLGQAALAAGVDLHVPVHRQRGAGVRALRQPGLRQRVPPVLHSLRVRREGLDLAPQRLGLGAAVQPQDRSPFPRSLVPQRLRVANPRHEQERKEKKNAGQPVIPFRQRQELARPVEQPLPEKHRKRGQNAAAGDRRQALLEDRPRLVHPARRGRDPPRAVPRAAAHRRLAVPPVPCAAVERSLRRLSVLRRLGRRLGPLLPPHVRRPVPDDALPPAVVHGRLGQAQLPGDRGPAHPRGQQAVRRLRRLADHHAGGAAPPRLVEARLALAAELVHGPLERRAADAQRLLQVLAAHPALGELGRPQQHRPAVALVVEVAHLEVREIVDLAVERGD